MEQFAITSQRCGLIVQWVPAVGRLKMRDWKMWHKNAGRENAGKENTAQEILGLKMRDMSVWKANRRFLCNIKWIIV